MPALVLVKDLVLSTLTLITSFFGAICVFGLLINLVSHSTFRSIEKAFYSRGTYLVAWLGTPIHELGHALFCLIFGHKIVEMELFKPDPLTGTLGYVYHKWNRSNPWQVLGNVFISIGPVILGGSVLFALFYFLIPDSSPAWESILSKVKSIQSNSSIWVYFEVLNTSALTMLRLIFTADNLTSWRFWIFIYLSICVASNIRLSLLDIKGSLRGLGYLVLLFFVINLVTSLTSIGLERIFHFIAPLLGIIYSLLIIALSMATFGFLLVYFISAVYVRIRRGYILNPFWIF